MKRLRRGGLLLAVVTLLLVQMGTAWAAELPKGAIHKPFERGTAVLYYGNDDYYEAKIDDTLARLASLNVDTISLIIPIFPYYDAPNRSWFVRTDPDKTPTNHRIGYFIHEAHRLNMKVVFRPLVDEEALQAKNLWRGNMPIENKAMWFAGYEHIWLEFLPVLQSEKVDGVCIGSELEGLEVREDASHWERIAAVVRGSLDPDTDISYAINWPYVESPPQLLNFVDTIGVDAYYPLRGVNEKSSEEAIYQAWDAWRNRILQVKRAYPMKRLVFTEVGVPSHGGSYDKPWNQKLNRPTDWEAQRKYYAASCRFLKELGDGIHWWGVAMERPDPVTDSSFEFLGKSAEAEVRKCFAGD